MVERWTNGALDTATWQTPRRNEPHEQPKDFRCREARGSSRNLQKSL